jgi:hypothetical protein
MVVGDKHIFNIINSAVFIALICLIQANILSTADKHLRRNPVIFFLVFVFVWRYAPVFGWTTLWLSGACNYLWTTTIILGFITIYRCRLETQNVAQDVRSTIVSCLSLFILGVIAGWCNENTSGGMILLLLMLTFAKIYSESPKSQAIKPYMIAAHLGALTGFLFMILSPAISVRMEIGHSDVVKNGGILEYGARLNLLLLAMEELFFELICIFVIVTVLAISYRGCKKAILTQSVPFLVAFLASSFAMILTRVPLIYRAYFGAGMFLIIACLRGIVLLFFDKNNDSELGESDGGMKKLLVNVRHIALILLCLWLIFDFQNRFVKLVHSYRVDPSLYREYYGIVEMFDEAMNNMK